MGKLCSNVWVAKETGEDEAGKSDHIGVVLSWDDLAEYSLLTQK